MILADAWSVAYPPSEITVQQAFEQVRSGEVGTWLVADQRGVVGVINRSRLERELGGGADKKLAELGDPQIFPHVHTDQGLDVALEQMGMNQIDILPVVSRANVHELKGVVTLRDVLKAYGVPSGLQGDSSRIASAPETIS